MLFNSLSYILFLPIVVFLFYRIPIKHRAHLLLLASYFFYMCWKVEYIFLILLSTGTDYYCGIQIDKAKNKSKQKTYLLISLIVNLGLLFFFKYYNFLFSSLQDILTSFGLHVENRTLDILLPVGISFYTFQTLAYTIDVYRGKIKAENNISKFALYVAFFPQLVAGPIERAQNLLHQFHFKTKISPQNFVKGFRLILWGFFKKIVMADNFARVVEQVYNNPLEQNAITYLIATLFFAFQIYCDFSGYSDIAIGSARLIGIRLMTNFNLPYISASFKEFWSRWHISLSTWFRDYLYIPLGGNRVKRSRNLINLFIVFLVSGIWHGANWTFVAWGGIHGILLVAEHTINTKIAKRLPLLFKQLFVFFLVLVSWIYFRASSITQANKIILNLLTDIPALISNYLSGISIFIGFGDISISLVLKFLILLIVFFSIDNMQKKVWFKRLFLKNNRVRMLIYFILLYSIIFIGYFGETAFIYFQF